MKEKKRFTEKIRRPLRFLEKALKSQSSLYKRVTEPSNKEHEKISYEDDGERNIHQTNCNTYEIFGEITQISEFFLQESNQTE